MIQPGLAGAVTKQCRYVVPDHFRKPKQGEAELKPHPVPPCRCLGGKILRYSHSHTQAGRCSGKVWAWGASAIVLLCEAWLPSSYRGARPTCHVSYHTGCPGKAEHGPQSTSCEEQTLSWVPPGQPGACRTCPGVEGKGGGTKQRRNKRHCGPERST